MAMSEQKQPPAYTYTIQSAATIAADWTRKRYRAWNGNRPLNVQRARSIAAHVTTSGDFGPVPIVIGVLHQPGERQNRADHIEYVIDGQHRLEAATLLLPDDAARTQLCVCRTVCSDEADLRRLFTAVNCGTPVPASYWDADIAAFICNVAAAVNNRWPGLITQGAKAIRPRITFVQFRSELDGHARTREAAAAQTLSVAAAIQQLDVMNEDIKRKIAGREDRRVSLANGAFGATSSILAAADRLDYLVGLDKHWPVTLMTNLGAIWRGDEIDE